MLLELAISDFAIVASTRLSFGSGLHVLTGETGAGKSILLDALGTVLGDRASAELVRTGERRARVEALFDLSDVRREQLATTLDEVGIEPEDDQLILTREIHANGRSVARVDGQIVTLSVLGRIGDALVDIHGQSDHFSIRRREEQRRILDTYSGTGELAAEVAEGTDAVLTLRRRIESLATGERERAQRRDLLAFQAEEIANAALLPGEEDALQREQRALAHAEQLREDTARALEHLSGDEAVDGGGADAVERARAVSALVSRVAVIDGDAESLAERAAEVLILAEDLARDLRAYHDGLEVDDARLEAIEDRLELLRTLKRKYGGTLDEVLAFGEAAQRELEVLGDDDLDIDTLTGRMHVAEGDLAQRAMALSAARRAGATRLAAEIEGSIAALHLGSAQMAIRVDRIDDSHGLPVVDEGEERRVRFDRTGIDDIEFLISPNRGEVLRPMARIASGGETARIMLAITAIISMHDAIPTLVFDEIDAGVGGRIGQIVGDRLRDLAQGRQVIAITHLPQIAAVAEHHARIEKVERDGRVISTVRQLDAPEVEQEIAAMLDGEPVTDTAIEAARAMIRRSRPDGTG